MDTRQERLSRLDSALLDKRQICSSEGVLCAFPSALKSPFMIDGVGLIICRQGSFTFILNQKTFSAKAGDTLFLPKDSLFQVLSDRPHTGLYGKLGSIHAPILASGHRTVLRMEYRRRRRGFKIPVTIGQYAENRRESF